MKISITQGALNLLRNLLAVPGLEKTPAEIYIGGELLVVVLPEVDVSWVKSPEQLAKLGEKETKEYLQKDAEWSAVIVDLELTDRQRDNIRSRLAKVPELAPQIGFSKQRFEVYKLFGFAPE